MKFSIVTPAYNMDRWISETIESVLSQKGNFEIEYIIVNDNSTDNTESIINEYVTKVNNGSYHLKCKSVSMKYIYRDKNGGMYDAINHGFSNATGDIYAWINADDVYASGAFEAVTNAFTAFPEIKWLKGITSTIDKDSSPIRNGVCHIFHQDWVSKGIYGQEAYFIEQDSVFWKKSLWTEIGYMPAHFRLAADYWLWIQFAQHAPLWSLNTPLSFFRKREGQLSKNIAGYKGEQKMIRPLKSLTAWKARLFFSPQSRLTVLFPRLNKFFIWLYPIVFTDMFPEEYIEIENEVPQKRSARSYIV